ncbi:MAG: tetratricopeptide repeat protein [Deltaproteobacteria bacterium]|nr:tetratricopeptide repeat protein [Deltaproteobacteria bacterium]
MRLFRTESLICSLLVLGVVLLLSSGAQGEDLTAAPFFKEYSKAVDAYNQGQLAKAESHLTASLEDYPNDLLAWNLLAEVYQRTGKHQKALEAYNQVERLYPGWPNTRRRMAYLYERTNDPQSARKIYLELLGTEPNDAELWQRLTDLLLRSNEENEAMHTLEKAVKTVQSKTLVRTLATLYFNRKEYEKAEPLFLDLARTEPREAPDSYCLGVIAHGRGNQTDAINRFHEALALRPDYFDACYNLGVLLKQGKRYPEALTTFETCSKIEPKNKDVYRQLGQICEENIMDMEKANAYFEKAGGRTP